MPQFTTVSATKICDASGSVITNATIYFEPVLNDGSPASVVVGEDGGLTTVTVISALISAGAFSVPLVNTGESAPANFAYSVTILDNLTSKQILGAGYSRFQPSGPTVAFDQTPPVLGQGQVIFQPGFIGPAGPAGANGTNGLSEEQVAAQIALAVDGTPSVNLYDYTGDVANCAMSYVTGTPGSVSDYTTTPKMLVNGATQYVSNGIVGFDGNGGYGPTFFDANGNNLGSDTGSTYAAAEDQSQSGDDTAPGTVHPIPSGAHSFQIYFADLKQPVPYSQIMVVAGTTLPTSYVPFGSTSNALVTTSQLNTAIATVMAGTGSSATPLAGVKLSWAGDSISHGLGSNVPLAPLVASLTGMTIETECSWSGRSMWNALDNTGNTGSAFPTQATIQATRVFVLWLGTNLNGAANGNIGTPSDTASLGTANANGITFPSTDTYCALLKGVLNQLLSWNPDLHIIKASPYQSANQNNPTGGGGPLPTAAGLALLSAVHTADFAVAGMQYGIPVLDLYTEIGICPTNITSLTVDNIHPTAATQNTRIGPYFARHILPYAGV